jgi:poly-gamma-glutamate synthesis protein (capsule biosynthesis protein)
MIEMEIFFDADSEIESVVRFSLDSGQEADTWIYLVVAPFYSYLDDVSSSDLYSCWKTGLDDGFSFRNIYATPETIEVLEHLWGPVNETCIQSKTGQEITESLWLETEVIAVIPFEDIEPALRIIPIDGNDPLSANFDRKEYPLALQIFYQVPDGVQLNTEKGLNFSNLDSSFLTSVALTGVTAMVRDTANIMEIQGITYPAGDIQEILAWADITHINNEVPFAVDCPSPEAYQVSLRFCSDDRYIELLEAVGTDIVELSGDHLGDWGPEAMLHTIDLYEQKGWPIYGGGRTLADGLAPVFLNHNGNRFAFIGCNGKKIDKYASASMDEPGAAQCDFSWMIPEITRLNDLGYIVIATMQHEEVDNFGSIALQQYDFRRLAEAGAVIVSGSQSHHPQAIEYTGSSFIHYGLGNLFFDQWFLAQYNPKQHLNKDKSFIDLHYFYQGKYIGTRLIPLQFIDNARPRPMTTEEMIPFLNEFYRSSLWNGEWIHLYSSGYMLNRIDQ